jgi:hypothetical protein
VQTTEAANVAIFVSHSSKDLLAAIEVLRTLHAYGHKDVFLDVDPAEGLIAGTHYTDQLSTNIDAPGLSFS